MVEEESLASFLHVNVLTKQGIMKEIDTFYPWHINESMCLVGYSHLHQHKKHIRHHSNKTNNMGPKIKVAFGKYNTMTISPKK